MNLLFDHLAFRSKIEPNAVAIKTAVQDLTFAQLTTHVRKIAGKLRHIGIHPGDIVATAIPGKHLDWLVTLALIHEAAVTCSSLGFSPAGASFELDWLIAERLTDSFDRQRTVLINQAWLRDALDPHPDVSVITAQPATGMSRLFLTSGTTGHTKAVGLDCEKIVERAKNSFQNSCQSKSFLSLLPLSTTLGVNNAVVQLLNGLPLYCPSSLQDAIRMLNENAIDGIHGSPRQIAQLMEASDALNIPIRPVQTVLYAGGSASSTLISKIRGRLSNNVYCDYGSTETAGLCIHRVATDSLESACGYAFPDVELEIVDDADCRVAPGQVGSIRAKRPHMADQYFNDPPLTSRHFKDGWFYPGDRGQLLEDGMLVLAGRDSELLNRGGIKIDPASIDSFLIDHPGVIDAAVFAYENKAGVQDMAAALVTEQAIDLKALQRDLLKRFGKARCPTVLLQVRQIPRNQMGKVMRADMSQRFAGVIAGLEAPTRTNAQ